MIEPLPPLDSSRVYIQLSRNTTGYLTIHTPETTSTTWLGYWTKQEDAQHDQMLKALKGVRTHLYELKLPI